MIHLQFIWIFNFITNYFLCEPYNLFIIYRLGIKKPQSEKSKVITLLGCEKIEIEDWYVVKRENQSH